MRLEDFLKDLKLGKVHPAYEILFPDNPLTQETPIKYWMAEECEYL